MKKFVCKVCGYIYEGEAAPAECLRPVAIRIPGQLIVRHTTAAPRA